MGISSHLTKTSNANTIKLQELVDIFLEYNEQLQQLRGEGGTPPSSGEELESYKALLIEANQTIVADPKFKLFLDKPLFRGMIQRKSGGKIKFKEEQEYQGHMMMGIYIDDVLFSHFIPEIDSEDELESASENSE